MATWPQPDLEQPGPSKCLAAYLTLYRMTNATRPATTMAIRIATPIPPYPLAHMPSSPFVTFRFAPKRRRWPTEAPYQRRHQSNVFMNFSKPTDESSGPLWQRMRATLYRHRANLANPAKLRRQMADVRTPTNISRALRTRPDIAEAPSPRAACRLYNASAWRQCPRAVVLSQYDSGPEGHARARLDRGGCSFGQYH